MPPELLRCADIHTMFWCLESVAGTSVLWRKRDKQRKGATLCVTQIDTGPILDDLRTGPLLDDLRIGPILDDLRIGPILDVLRIGPG